MTLRHNLGCDVTGCIWNYHYETEQWISIQANCPNAVIQQSSNLLKIKTIGFWPKY